MTTAVSATSEAAPPRGFAALVLALLPVAGIALWFTAGFPWGNHNESYDWVVRLETRNLWPFIVEKMPTVLSYRPLGTGLAWVLYRLAGDSIAPVQLANFLITSLGWVAMGRVLGAPRLYAALALVAGGVLFSGYIFLFHLHGVFYGPVFVQLALLVRTWRRGTVPADLPRLFGWSALVALFHPFALLLVAAFVAGSVLEWPSFRTRGGLALSAAAIVVAYVLSLVLVPPYNRTVPLDPWRGLLVSYRMVDVQAVVGGLSAALALAAITPLRRLDARWRLGACVGVGACVGLVSAPLTLAWPLACLAVCALQRWWSVGAVLGMAFLLPLPNPMGSPTYTVYALFLCVAVTTLSLARFESHLAKLGGPAALALLVLLPTLGAVLAAGVDVPVLSRLARPLLAEKERTHQMERLIRDYVASPWRRHAVALIAVPENPVNAADARDRRYRPPTNQKHLDTILAHRRGGPPTDSDTLRLGFGGDQVAGGEPVLRVPGRWAGDATLFRVRPVSHAGATLNP